MTHRVLFTSAVACLLMLHTSRAQWVQTAGPRGGSHIYALSVRGAEIFAGTDNGVFFSTDGGASWQPRGLGGQYVVSLVLKDSKLFAAVGTIGILLSTDDGVTWQYGGLSGLVNAIVQNGPNLFAGTDRGVFLSTDNGGSWQVLSNGLPSTYVWSLAVSGSTLLAGTDTGGVFLSTNNGSDWHAANNGITNPRVRSLAFDGSTFLAGTIEGGVFRSTDNGTSWQTINNGFGTIAVIVRAIAPSAAGIFAATINGVFRSTDHGDSWESVNNGLRPNDTFYSFALDSSRVFAGGSSGLFLSTTGGESWQTIGLYSEVTCMAVSGSKIFAGTYLAGLQSTTDEGASWIAVDNELFRSGDGMHSVYAHDSTIVASVGPFIYHSTDDGVSWTKSNVAISGYPTAHCFAHHDSLFFAGTSWAGALASPDRGANWQYSGLYGYEVNSLVSWGQDVFAGTYQGVFRSSDGGTTWLKSDSGIAFPRVQALAVCGSDIFAGTYGQGVFRSRDGGTMWSLASDGMPPADVTALVSQGTSLFAGTDGSGVFHSSNAGVSWESVNTGLTNGSVLCLSIKGSNIFAGTWGGGVLRRPLSEMGTGIEDPLQSPPSAFTLQQNYPNPFNPTTTIEFSLDRAQEVVLKVWNVLGQTVAILIDGQLGPGRHVVRFEGRGLPTGVYFYRLEAGSFVQTKKLLLLK